MRRCSDEKEKKRKLTQRHGGTERDADERKETKVTKGLEAVETLRGCLGDQL